MNKLIKPSSQRRSKLYKKALKNNYKILLIENSKVDQIAFKRMVKENDLAYDYTIAGSVAEAKKVLRPEKFDLVLAEYDLEDGTAVDILKLKIDPPIIIITSKNSEEIAVKAMKAGAYDYLSKNPDGNHLKVLPLIIEKAIQLKQTEQQFQALISHIPGAIYCCACDADSTMDFISDAISDISGYPASDFIRNQVRSFASIIYPDDTVGVEQIVSQSLTLHTPYVLEYRIIRADGSIRWVYEKGQGFFSEKGQITCRDGVIFDITERKQVEKRLEAQHATTRVLAEAATIEEAIPKILCALCESLGWQLGEYWSITEDNVLRCLESWQVESLQSQKILQNFSTSITFAPGVGLPGRIWMSGTPQWIVDVTQDSHFLRGTNALNSGLYSAFGFPVISNSKILGVLTFFNLDKKPLDEDLLKMMTTIGSQIGLFIERQFAKEALQQSEAHLRQQTIQLQKALQELKYTHSQLIQSEKMSALGQLVAGVAHEINNPVSFIHGNLYHTNQYIQDLLNLLRLYQQHYPNPVVEIQSESEEIDIDFLVEDLPKLLDSMNVGTERIYEIVLSLRNFSRLDEGEKKPVDIHEGIDSTLLILQNQLKAQGQRSAIEIIKEYGNLPPVVCCLGQLNQVFLNILNNAIDALEEQRSKGEAETPFIRIHSEVIENGDIVIQITDNGSGMTQEVQKQIFEPFFTTKPIDKGTGLGLSISYQIIVEKHGGILKCTSKTKQGTQFWIQMPVNGE